MLNKKQVREEIEATAGRLLDEKSSDCVQLRLARDVLHDNALTRKAAAKGVPDDHLARQMLRNVEFSSAHMKTDVGGNVRGSVGSAFIVARNAGLTANDPQVAQCIDDTANFIRHCERERPWENSSLHGTKRFTTIRYIIKLPGALARIKPKHPIVKRYATKAVALLNAQMTEDDFSLEREDELWFDIYGEKLISREALSVYRNLAFCPTTYAMVLGGLTFPLIGALASTLDTKVADRYCRMVLNLHPLIDKGPNWEDRIIENKFANPARFAQGVAIHMKTMWDLQMYPNWRVHAKRFVEWLWNQRREDGLWDFGSPHGGTGGTMHLRISESWRGKHRTWDWTTQVLLLMRAYVAD